MKTSKGVKKINFYYKIMPTAQKTVFLFASMYVIWLKAIRNWQYFRVAIFYQFEDNPQEKVLRALNFQRSYLFSAEKYFLVNAEKKSWWFFTFHLSIFSCSSFKKLTSQTDKQNQNDKIHDQWFGSFAAQSAFDPS